jgi:hypothetical protein
LGLVAGGELGRALRMAGLRVAYLTDEIFPIFSICNILNLKVKEKMHRIYMIVNRTSKK